VQCLHLQGLAVLGRVTWHNIPEDLNLVFYLYIYMPVPVATRSKAWVCGRLPAEIVGSNFTGGHGCLSVVSVVCCQVEVSAAG
jgi:hypothetical protein